MKKIILIAAGAVLVLGGGIGGTIAIMGLGRPAAAAQAAKPPPRPIFFAELADLVVSVPADANDAAPAYVQITLQFSTLDNHAVTSFGTLQPIIKAQIIALLMGQTAKALMDPATHDALTTQCQGIVNKVLDSAAGYTPPDPFTAAYITSLVEQN